MSEVLNAMPSAMSLYLKAAGSASKKPKGKPAIPALEVRKEQMAVDAANLAAYNALCGFSASESLPITYPQVMVSALHLYLMSRPAFPLPMLGLVHLRNHIEQTRPLRTDETFAVVVRTGDSREVRQGLEFDVLTELSVAGETPWRSVMTILFRVPGPKGAAAKPAAAAPALAEYKSFDAPADTGRKYAKVSGDYNPIHMSAMSAKLFGFPRAIAHGMWTLARVTALVQDQLGGAVPKQLDVQFKLPLLLPGRVAAKFQRDQAGVNFAVLARTSDKVHLTGSLR